MIKCEKATERSTTSTTKRPRQRWVSNSVFFFTIDIFCFCQTAADEITNIDSTHSGGLPYTKNYTTFFHFFVSKYKHPPRVRIREEHLVQQGGRVRRRENPYLKNKLKKKEEKKLIKNTVPYSLQEKEKKRSSYYKHSYRIYIKKKVPNPAFPNRKTPTKEHLGIPSAHTIHLELDKGKK